MPLVLASNIVVGVVFVLLGLRQNQTAGYPLIAGDYVGQLVFLIAAAVIAPLGEELLFRGYFRFNAVAIGTKLQMRIRHISAIHARTPTIILVSLRLL